MKMSKFPDGAMNSKSKANQRKSHENQLRLSQYLYLRRCKPPPSMKKLFSFAAESVLKLGVDINYQVPVNSHATLDSTPLAGCTLLHLAVLERDLNSVKVFLERGADFTIKDSNGYTPLQRVIEQVTNQNRMIYNLKGKLQPHLIANALLLAQINTGNASNPDNKYGISHFHIACLTNNERAVELFLKKGTLINEAVNWDSPYFPGFTGLHFAAQYSCLAIAKLLLDNGADASIEDAKGMSPLNLLIERNMNIADFLIMEKQVSCPALFNEMSTNESIIQAIIESTPNFVETFQLSLLHVYCTFREYTMLERLLQNKNVNALTNSKSWPRYTPLHFAAHFSVDTVKLLLQRGANILAKDLEGTTPLDLCMERYTPDIIHEFLSIPACFQDITLADDSINLLDLLMSLILAMNNEKLLEFFLENFGNPDLALTSDSPLWPGYTLLHLLVSFTKVKKDFNRFYYELDYEIERKRKGCLNFINLEVFLKHGASINVKDACGRTPVHLAYFLQKPELVKLLLNFGEQALIENPCDSSGLSHLNIACAVGDVKAVENFLQNGVDVNHPTECSSESSEKKSKLALPVKNNCTPLHIAVFNGNSKIIRLLLEYGADPYAEDSRNFTPINLAFKFTQNITLPFYFLSEDHSLSLLLSGEDLIDSVVEDFGLSHLHVAAFACDTRAIEKLLQNGADVNIQIRKRDDYPEELAFLSKYAGKTPLHVAVEENHPRTMEFLIENGADIYLKDADGRTPMYYAMKSTLLKNIVPFIPHLKFDDSEYITELGITMLHLACWMCEYDLVKELLENDADVDAPIIKGPVWLGYTPLHMLLICPNDEFEETLDLLLSYEADLTIKESSMNRTPLHLSNHYIMQEIESKGFSMRSSIPIDTLKSFDVNPKDEDGITHFHLACLSKNVNIIEEFLSHGVDINEAIDPLANTIYAGFTPLHLAVLSGSEETIMILIENGADITVEDTEGRTPYQIGLNKSFSSTLMNMLRY